MKNYLYLLASSLLLSSALHAENIHLVKDVNNNAIREYMEWNGMLYFTTNNTLWKTDGSPAGTSMIANFSSISALTGYRTGIYFIAQDSLGNELWTSDGTAAGTHIVKDINPGADPAFNNADFFAANQIKVLNNKLLFIADDGVHGKELWESSGTAGTTQMVADLNPIPYKGIVYGYPDYNMLSAFEVFNNALYFYGNDSNGHNGLWTYDGVSAPAFLKSLDLDRFMIAGNKLFFEGVRSDTSYSYYSGLWETDGTVAGTILIDSNVATTNDYAVLNGDLYFFGHLSDTSPVYQVWKTDGTLQGTVILKDNLSANAGTSPSHYNKKQIHLTTFNNRVYFGYNGLWATDGTVGGTVNIYSNPGGSWKSASFPVVANNKLYFKMSDGQRVDMWSTDGTAANTHKVIDPAVAYPNGSVLAVPPILSSPTQLFNNSLYYLGRYDSTISTSELYRMDFNSTEVTTINQPKTAAALYPNPAGDMIRVNNASVSSITIFDITGRKLFTSKGREANVSALQPGIYIAEMLDDQGVKTTAKFLKQ